jgi:hypothetical protein
MIFGVSHVQPLDQNPETGMEGTLRAVEKHPRIMDASMIGFRVFVRLNAVYRSPRRYSSTH